MEQDAIAIVHFQCTKRQWRTLKPSGKQATTEIVKAQEKCNGIVYNMYANQAQRTRRLCVWEGEMKPRPERERMIIIQFSRETVTALSGRSSVTRIFLFGRVCSASRFRLRSESPLSLGSIYRIYPLVEPVNGAVRLVGEGCCDGGTLAEGPTTGAAIFGRPLGLFAAGSFT